MKRATIEIGNAGAVRSTRRGGAIVIAAMICLFLSSLLLASLLKQAAVQQLQLRQWERAQQADWLAESALERAVGRLDSDINYQGETWQLAADEFNGRGAGQAVIRIEPVDGQVDAWRIVVTARFPNQLPQAVQRTKQIQVTIRR